MKTATTVQNEEFPANNLLGYALDLSQTVPLDISAARTAINAVQTNCRIVSYDTELNVRPLEVDGVVYDVPKTIGIDHHDDSSSSSFLTFAAGRDASSVFGSNSSLGFQHFAVTGGHSVITATEKTFRPDKLCAFYGFSKNCYSAYLRDFTEFLNTDALVIGVRQLPKPFDRENVETLRNYEDFFHRYGSHVIVRLRYGARIQMTAWASPRQENEDVIATWPAIVNAKFGGIPNGDTSDQNILVRHNVFNDIQTIASAHGGDRELAAALSRKPHRLEDFEKWTKTLSMRSSIVGFVVTEIWLLMKSSHNEDLHKNAGSLQEAFESIVAKPRLFKTAVESIVAKPRRYKTAVTIYVQSDWVEFGLLTPTAHIAGGDDSLLPDTTHIQRSQLTWGKKRDFHVQTIKFNVINDGSPIDFYTSHGSDGCQPSEGCARVTFGGQTYVNQGITDNRGNIVWFYGASVNGSPMD